MRAHSQGMHSRHALRFPLTTAGSLRSGHRNRVDQPPKGQRTRAPRRRGINVYSFQDANSQGFPGIV
ncbi:hypothetical protein [Polaromonas sp. CG9_12]|nr:hypothetical protein [Polaromonas sp. CG9_12]